MEILGQELSEEEKSKDNRTRKVPNYKRVVIKIGSNVLADDEGLPDIEILARLSKEITKLKRNGTDVILISSGAVAAGRGLVARRNIDGEENKQMLSAIGQVRMINIYNDLFGQYGLFAAQVMVTKGAFRNQSHYLNMQTCFESLLSRDVIPVVNENDVIAHTDLSFTDNDELAGLLACTLYADAVFILTNVDGLYDKDPEKADAQLLHEVSSSDERVARFIAPSKSKHGRGGMRTKAQVAQRLAHLGVHAYIVNGRKLGIISAVMSGLNVGTHFEADEHRGDLKGWLTHLDSAAKGKLFVNKETSLRMSDKNVESDVLPEHVERIEGQFEEGDIIQIHDAESQDVLATAMADTDHESAQEAMDSGSEEPLVDAKHVSIDHKHHMNNSSELEEEREKELESKKK